MQKRESQEIGSDDGRAESANNSTKKSRRARVSSGERNYVCGCSKVI